MIENEFAITSLCPYSGSISKLSEVNNEYPVPPGNIYFSQFFKLSSDVIGIYSD